jgi:hypothetical protein
VRSLVAIVIAAALSGCAVSGPGIVGPSYVASAGDTSMRSNWYSNNMLGDALTFNAPSVEGALVAGADRLAFVVEDPATGRQFTAWEAPLSSVTWITAKDHGLARIIRLKAGDSIHSFLFSSSSSDGVSKDAFVARVLSKFRPI